VQDRLVFLIGAPRSGSTLLARVLGAHSTIHAPDEPHLVTPLAHLGYFASVEKAPYDPVITAAAQRALVAALPGGERDYLDAMRALSDHLYRRLLEASGRGLLLDKTPAYALVLEVLAKLYPAARYVVLTRHPIAIWSSYVDSFFDGDDAVAHAHNPLLERYVPAIARFLRERPVPLVHVRYEALVQDPEATLKRVTAHLGIGYEPAMIEYGREAREAARGLGDPRTVSHETRPTTDFVERWKDETARRPGAVACARAILDRLLDEDLEAWGHARAAIAAELDAIAGAPARRRRAALDRHALERRLLVALRRNIHHNAFGRVVRRVRGVCDVLLR